MSNEYRVYPVDPDEGAQLKVRKKVPIDRIICLLLEGYEVFIECDRRTAHYIKRRISGELGVHVESYPSIYRGMDGYVFKISIVKQFLDELSKGNH
jgi:hypothetical protein